MAYKGRQLAYVKGYADGNGANPTKNAVGQAGFCHVALKNLSRSITRIWRFPSLWLENLKILQHITIRRY